MPVKHITPIKIQDVSKKEVFTGFKICNFNTDEWRRQIQKIKFIQGTEKNCSCKKLEEIISLIEAYVA